MLSGPNCPPLFLPLMKSLKPSSRAALVKAVSDGSARESTRRIWRVAEVDRRDRRGRSAGARRRRRDPEPRRPDRHPVTTALVVPHGAPGGGAGAGPAAAGE